MKTENEKRMISMNVLEEAITFAVEAHGGQTRKLAQTPFILHPLETAAIIATMTSDRETMAAGVLHDTVEDAGVSFETIRGRFGARVEELVRSETEDRSSALPKDASWEARKLDSLAVLRNTEDREVKILWLGDKLSNMRSFYREYQKCGNAIFQGLNQKDPERQGWYYKTIASCLSELSGTEAYREYLWLIGRVFDGDNEK